MLCELAWVLIRGYGYERETVARVLRRLLSVQELHAVNSDMASRAVRLFEHGKGDFADYMIGLGNREAKAHVTYTLDKRAAESDLFHLVPYGEVD